ncbi:hypothetical protein [Curtobacterium sp. VKM Ac-1395]|uniref:hypothetical protein n=1 Tax=Curtobacterium sp. VKM Ac-1395 TaxID=2783815 RepID=UPI00188B40BB|nr:hypothetical protein [Curtobacterium sp. VKM Ac-1395]MBF4591205.1 hypothetical protein [Curtobacterium sp. VKM Ac-1395]
MTHLTVFSIASTDPDPSARRRLSAAARRGALRRLTAGRYVLAEAAESASDHEVHRARIDAVLPGVAPHVIVSHESAVVLHGLPWVGSLPEVVVVSDPHLGTGHRRAHVQKVGAAGRRLDPVVIAGHAVTSLAVTAVDIALRAPFRTAVVVLDAVLARGIERDVLIAELRARTPRPRAVTRARLAIEFADAASGSPGESVARVRMAQDGFPQPVLQQEFHDEGGFVARVDFWFPEVGVVVEFDGLAKYRDRALRGGRSPEQVVVDEKLREDRLRAVPGVRTVVRLTWRDVDDGGSAPQRLDAAGVPRANRTQDTGVLQSSRG